MSIHALQLLTAISWLTAAVFLSPGTLRAFFGTSRFGDHAKSGFFFVAVVMICGCARFLVRPDDITSWKFIYALSTLTAVYVLVLVWNIRRDLGGR